MQGLTQEQWMEFIELFRKDTGLVVDNDQNAEQFFMWLRERADAQ